MSTKSDEQFTEIRSESTVSKVYTQIREKLLSGGLAPGEPLRESVMATRMNVSRAPVREALRLLEQSGLIVKAHNHSYSVTSFNESDAAELAALRLADETLSIRVVVQKRVSLEPMAVELAKMRAAQNVGDLEGMHRADSEFHRKLVALTELPKLIARYENLRDQMRFAIRSFNFPPKLMNADHTGRHELLFQAIADAYPTGDVAKAITLLEEHILNAAYGDKLFSPLVFSREETADATFS